MPKLACSAQTRKSIAFIWLFGALYMYISAITPKKCQHLKFENKSISPQAGCRFECMLQNAYDTCKCTPWNFPYIETGEMEICDMFGRLKDISTPSFSHPISTPYFSIVNSSTPDFLTPDFSTPDFSTTRGLKVWGWILGLKNPGLKLLANQKSVLVEEYTV